jgi:predicted aspartyl protease
MMSKMITSKLLAMWCLISLWGVPLFPLSARAATTVKFTLVRNYLIVVSVTVAGSRSHEFLLDTGTNTTLLQTEFAQQLGLPPRDRIELMTVAGSQIVPRAQLPQLSFAGQTVTNLEVLFSDLREIRAVLPQVRGVLGQNFLSQCNYLVDYARREISLGDEAEARWCGERLPFTMHEGRVLLTLNPLGNLVLDSGIAELLLFDTAQQQARLSLKQEEDRPRQLKSDVGQQTVWQSKLPSLQIGKLVLPNLPVTLLPPSSADEGRTEAGLLPMSLFRSIYVNHRQNYVILNPSPSLPANQSAKPPLDAAVTRPR